MVKVILYGTSSCEWCEKTRNFLKKKKIKFSDLDVEKKKSIAEEAFKKSGEMVVPVIDVDGEILIGFDELKLKKLLKIK